MQVGVFLPIGNNGWLVSTTSPQYKPSFDLNRAVVEMAERFGFDLLRWFLRGVPDGVCHDC
jgi:pyrimidine oxygenase